MSLIENPQRRDQFAAEHRAAPALIGQGRKRRRHRVAALRLAEIALDAPQRNNEARLDVEALLHALQQRRIFGEVAPGILNPLRVDDLGDELSEAQHVIGLALVELDDPWQELYVTEREIDGCWTNPGCERVAPQTGEKTVEIASRCYRSAAPQRHRQ